MRRTSVHVLLLLGLLLAICGQANSQTDPQPPADKSVADVPPTPEEVFMDAVGEGNLEVVRKMLLANPALISARDEAKATALHVAVDNGKAEVVKFMLEKKAEVNARNQLEQTPLFLATGPDTEDSLTITGLLLAAKADPNIADAEGNTPLHQSIEIALSELLVAKGANIAARNNEGRTPLHEAVVSGAKAIVELLLNNKADVNAIDKEGNTPLHLLVTRIDTDHDWTLSLALILLDNKADLSVKNKAGATPLKMALDQKDDAALIELLKKRGATE